MKKYSGNIRNTDKKGPGVKRYKKAGNEKDGMNKSGHEKNEMMSLVHDLGRLSGLVSMVQGDRTKTRDNIEGSKQQRSESKKKGRNGREASGRGERIKDVHGGSVTWTCAAERQKGQHRVRAWEHTGGRPHCT